MNNLNFFLTDNDIRDIKKYGFCIIVYHEKKIEIKITYKDGNYNFKIISHNED